MKSKKGMLLKLKYIRNALELGAEEWGIIKEQTRFNEDAAEEIAAGDETFRRAFKALEALEHKYE